jgi:MFS family permease
MDRYSDAMPIQSTTFIAALNYTVVATAIPTICSDLHSAAGYSWIGAAYVIANTAAGPIWVKISDIWGRKPVVLTAVALYFLSSILCAVSNSMGMLIVSRSLQGAAGSGAGGLTSIVISDLFSMRSASQGCVLRHIIDTV